ncbi:YbaB/EbfC family nucleoid-associated protein [Nonomuraea sp. NPDC048826]|uniref:YbaB/EbfC family nucleoid-associated protein n=1 Tax=Nonomuraea sp. NPDC048826 TaxID=3364347 RepID=UPI003714E58E
MFGFDLDLGDIREQDVLRSAEQAERLEALLAEQEARVAEIVGAGAGDRGQVRAGAAADGRVLHVTLGPQATRDGSHVLSEEILLAVRRAHEDAQRQAEELLRTAVEEALPGVDLAALTARLNALG